VTRNSKHTALYSANISEVLLSEISFSRVSDFSFAYLPVCESLLPRRRHQIDGTKRLVSLAKDTRNVACLTPNFNMVVITGI